MPDEMRSGDFVVRRRDVRTGVESSVTIPLDEENARWQLHFQLNDPMGLEREARRGAQESSEFFVARMIYVRVA